MRLIDFGSAADAYSLEHLYGSDGPSADQQTELYAPPEARIGDYWQGGRHVSACRVLSCRTVYIGFAISDHLQRALPMLMKHLMCLSIAQAHVAVRHLERWRGVAGAVAR